MRTVHTLQMLLYASRADPENMARVPALEFFLVINVFHTSLEKQLNPRWSVPVFLMKHIATCDLLRGGSEPPCPSPYSSAHVNVIKQTGLLSVVRQ